VTTVPPTVRRTGRLIAGVLALAALLRAETPRPLTIGFIAKAQSNPVFDAARTGALEAAKELGAKYHLSIAIDWRTPDEEDAQKQSETIDELVLAGSDAIAISCTDPSEVTEAIDSAVANGVPVATFDSDAPKSRRFVSFGIDDEACGQLLMDELARQLGGKGMVAILGGTESAADLQARIRGVKAAARNYPGIKIVGTYYHKESQADASARLDDVMQDRPKIAGWVFVGGWPLYAPSALK
jgi:ribose transport system substrate-binding protein